MLIAILLGVIFGSCASGFIGWYLWFTRSGRRVRNMFVIRSGYLVVTVSGVGSLALLREVLNRLGLLDESHSRWPFWAYAASVMIVMCLVGRSEDRWRKTFQSKKSENDSRK